MLKSCITRPFFVAIFLAAFAGAGCGSSPTTPTTVDLTGTWVGTATETAHPELPDRVTLVLSKVSSGYQGTISDQAGNIAPGTPILNASWNAPTLTFACQMRDGTGVNVTVQISGDTMSGSYVDSQGFRGTVTCTRQR